MCAHSASRDTDTHTQGRGKLQGRVMSGLIAAHRRPMTCLHAVIKPSRHGKAGDAAHAKLAARAMWHSAAAERSARDARKQRSVMSAVRELHHGLPLALHCCLQDNLETTTGSSSHTGTLGTPTGTDVYSAATRECSVSSGPRHRANHTRTLRILCAAFASL